MVKRADAAAEAILRVCLLRWFLQLSLVQTFAPITFIVMIKIGYFSVGLTWLTFLRPGKMLKNDAREGENPQKSGSFLSMGSVLPLGPMLRFHVVGFWVLNSKLQRVGGRWKHTICGAGVFSVHLSAEA